MLDLEPGWDFLYINSVAFSTLTRRLISIDESSVQLNFYSDEIYNNYQGLKMTVMLGDYGKGLHAAKTN
jgi:hypothetical protein